MSSLQEKKVVYEIQEFEFKLLSDLSMLIENSDLQQTYFEIVEVFLSSEFTLYATEKDFKNLKELLSFLRKLIENQHYYK
jgi:hypothetical protein